MVANPFSDGLNVKVSSDTADFNDGIDDAINKLGSMKGAVGALGGALAAVSAGALAKATSAAADFESQMADVQKVTSEAVATELKDEIMGLAEEIPVARKELVTLAEMAGKFGAESTEEIKTFVETVGQIQTATDLAAEEAGKRFAKIAGAVGMPLTEIDKLGNAVNILSDSMKTDAAEITDTATRASNVLAQQLGLGEDTVLALSASMNEVSPSSRRAAGALKRAAESLLDPKKVSDVAAAIGMTSDEFRTMREEDPQGLMRKVAKTMNDGGDAAVALRQALGKQATRAFSKLGSQMEVTDEAQEKVNQQFKDGTSLQEEMSIRTNTAAGKWQLFVNKLQNLATTIGDQVLPYATKLLDWASGVIDRFSKLKEKSDGLIATLTLVGTTIGGAASALFFLAGGPITAVIAAVGALAAAFTTDFGGIRTTVEDALSHVKDELKFITESIQGFVEKAKMAFNEFEAGNLEQAFRILRDAAVDLLGDIATAIFGGDGSGGGLLDTAIGGLADWLKSTGKQLVSAAFQALGEGIRLVLKDIWKALNGEESIIGDAIGMLVEYLETDAAGDLEEAATVAFGLLLTAVENLLQGLTGADGDASIESMLGDVATWLKTDGKAALAAAGEQAFDALLAAGETLVKELITNDDSVIKSFAADAAAYLKNQATTDLKNAAEALWTGVRTMFDEWISWDGKLGQVIKDFIAAVKEYFTSGQAQTDLKAGAKALGRGIRETFLAWFELNKKLGQVIKDFIAAVYDYISSGQAFDDMKEAFRLLGEGVKAVVETFFSMGEKLGPVIKGFFEDLYDYVATGKAFEDMKAAFEILTGMIFGIFEGLFEGLFYGSLIKDFFSDISSYIDVGGGGFKLLTTAFDNLIAWVEGIWSDFKKWLVGESGEGGLVDDLVSGVFSLWTSLAKWLVGESGEGGLVGDIVSGVFSLWESMAKRLVGEDGESGAIGGLASDITGIFSGLKDTLVGNSIVPDMLSDMIDEADEFVDPFLSPFREAKQNAIKEFNEIQSKIAGARRTKARVQDQAGIIEDNGGGGGGGSSGGSKAASEIRDSFYNSEGFIPTGAAAKKFDRTVKLSELAEAGVGPSLDELISAAKSQGITGNPPEGFFMNNAPVSIHTGGKIGKEGLAMLDAGEFVLSESDVDRNADPPGGTTIVVKNNEFGGNYTADDVGDAIYREVASKL